MRAGAAQPGPAADEGTDVRELLAALRPVGALSAYHDLVSGAALFPQFVAVAAHLRPAMDCWVPARNLDAFATFAEQLGLAVSFDCAFRELAGAARDRVVGIETLCTTYAAGIRIEEAEAGDTVHAFVAGSRELAQEARACGWYPVVIKDRLFHKPQIDHLAFGRLLGYPDCCIGFFDRSNNWNRTNSYAEAHLKTAAGCDHRTNCFGKNLGYSLTFHIPCRFDCPETIRFATALEKFLASREPAYAAACRQLLHKPVLSLNEREIVVLDGTFVGECRVAYRDAVDLFATPEPVLRAIRAGNTVEIRGRFVLVFRNRELVDVIECRCDEFGPRVPLLIRWS
jgi:hypothetical protein